MLRFVAVELFVLVGVAFAMKSVRNISNLKKRCDKEIKQLADKKKELEQAEGKLTVAIAESKETIGALADEIKVFEAAVVALVKIMAEATEHVGKFDLADDKKKEHERAESKLTARITDSKETIAALANEMKVLEEAIVALGATVESYTGEADRTPYKYVEGTILNAAADLRLGHKTEELVQESCDADEDCIGYYQRSMKNGTLLYIKVTHGTEIVGVKTPIPEIMWAKLKVRSMSSIAAVEM